jgi:hypothetical protein
MTVVCRNKPNRSLESRRARAASAADAARFVCGAISNGETQKAILQALLARGCWTEAEAECEEEKAKVREKQAQLEAVAAEALKLTSENSAVSAIATKAVGAIAVQLTALLVLVGLIPFVGVGARSAVNVARLEVAHLLADLAAQRAANAAAARFIQNLVVRSLETVS